MSGCPSLHVARMRPVAAAISIVRSPPSHSLRDCGGIRRSRRPDFWCRQIGAGQFDPVFALCPISARTVPKAGPFTPSGSGNVAGVEHDRRGTFSRIGTISISFAAVPFDSWISAELVDSVIVDSGSIISGVVPRLRHVEADPRAPVRAMRFHSSPYTIL